MPRQREATDVFRYDSYHDVMVKIASPPINPKNRATWERDFNMDDANMLNSAHELGTDCFAAIKKSGKPFNITTVTEWLRAGWPKGVARIREEMGKIELPGMTDIRRRPRWKPAGDELSTDKLYGGDFDRCWREYSRGTVHRPPPIHLFCDISVNCGDNALFWRGATTFAFAEAAIKAGHRVRVDQVVNIEGLSKSGSGFLAIIRIKDYGGALNPSVLAAVSANTASMRLTDFGHCTHIPETMTCYGRVATLDFNRLISRGVVDRKAHSLLVSNQIQSKQAAHNWIASVGRDLEMRVQTGNWQARATDGLVSPARAEWER